jgi:hypothetical protein
MIHSRLLRDLIIKFIEGGGIKVFYKHLQKVFNVMMDGLHLATNVIFFSLSDDHRNLGL